MQKDTIAYHFVGDTLRDGRPAPEVGVRLTHEGSIKICESGLHASKDPFDALPYAPGPVLCKVFCEDIFEEQENKLVCRHRTIIVKHDATDMLRKFARSCALDVIGNWNAPDVVRQYLEVGDESLREAAYSAARSAASSAYSTYSAYSATNSTNPAYSAYYAAKFAVYSAVYSADLAAYSAYSAANSAYSAASSAAYSAYSAANSAYSAASSAYSAASSAARKNQRVKFNQMVAELFDSLV